MNRAVDARLLTYARATRPFLIALVVVGTAGAALIIVQAWLLADIIAAAFAGGKGIAALSLPFAVLLAVVVARAPSAGDARSWPIAPRHGSRPSYATRCWSMSPPSGPDARRIGGPVRSPC